VFFGAIMEDIIQEKISADHLLYVSLKYTKTCDVMVNLILRWRKMIETAIDSVLKKAKKEKKISEISTNPVGKIKDMRKIFRSSKNMQVVLDDYEMFRKIEDLRKERSGEFRKNVTLKIFYQGNEISVNLEKLKEYAANLENFIDNIKKYLTK
jgi:hypothetical protein